MKSTILRRDKHIFYYNGDCVGSFIKKWGGHNPHFTQHKLYELLDRVIKPGTNAIEIGAHNGIESLYIAKRIGHEGYLWCFEPQKKLLPTLQKNINENGFNERVRIVDKGVFDKNGSEKLKIPGAPDEKCANLKEQAVISSILPNRINITPRLGTYDWSEEDIEVVKLDNYFENNQRIDFILSRLAGTELHIFRGAENLLKKNNIKMLIEWYPKLPLEKHKQLFDFLSKLNYTIYRIKKDGMVKINIPQDLQKVYPKGCWVDVFIEKNTQVANHL